MDLLVNQSHRFVSTARKDEEMEDRGYSDRDDEGDGDRYPQGG